MNKNDFADIFNCFLTGTPVDFNNRLIPIILEYLTDIKCENTQKTISLLRNNPPILSNLMGKLIPYFCRKYSINSVLFNNKTLMYYVTN